MREIVSLEDLTLPEENKSLIWKEIVISWFLSTKCLSKEDRETYEFFFNKNIKQRKFESIFAWISKDRYEEKYILKARLRSISFIVSKSFFEKYFPILSNKNMGSISSDDYNKRWLWWTWWPSQKIVYIWDSLKILLSKTWYHDYEGWIKIYWVYWSIESDRRSRNIWKIFKADILDEEGNILKTII